MILQVVQEVAVELWRLVHPRLGLRSGAAIVGTAQSGDYTYALDHDAEEALPAIVAKAGERCNLNVAYYSEDKGLVCPYDEPDYVLVIDPIDGTRPALCGLECCCISVAAAPMETPLARPVFGDLAASCLVEAKSGQTLSAQKGAGVWMGTAASAGPTMIHSFRLLERADKSPRAVETMFWAYENAGRPLAATAQVLGDLINCSSHAGATFVMNSSSFAISRVVTGQLDAYVDVFAALLQGPAADSWAEHARSLFRGKVFGLFAYDIAAAVLLADEAGFYVSDAFGNPIKSVELLDSSEQNLVSIVVACDPNLGDSIAKKLHQGLANGSHGPFIHMAR